MEELLRQIETLLAKTTISRDRGNNGSKRRKNVADENPQTALIGLIKNISTQKVVPTKFTVDPKNRELIDLLHLLGSTWSYTHIQINQNFECRPHRDKNNQGNSVILTLGSFTGGHLGVEENGEKKTIDLFHSPYLFNGSLVTHWTEPFRGNRYSLIYFTWKGLLGNRLES